MQFETIVRPPVFRLLPSISIYFRHAASPAAAAIDCLGGLCSQPLVRLELGKDDKVVNEEALLTDGDQRIREVRVFADGAVYVLTDGEGGKFLKLTPKQNIK